MAGGLVEQADARQRAVWSLQQAVRTTAREVFGAAVVERAVAGLSIPDRDVQPLAGVRAAVLACDVAAARVRYYALRARAGGSSWDDVAEALGVGQDDAGQWSRAELAYLHLVEGHSLQPDQQRYWPTSASWCCGCCEQQVTDRGPFMAAPQDNETGHAPDCARHAAQVAAYRAERGES